MRANLPLVVEALSCPSERIPDPNAPEAMASAARISFEHGADLVKSYYTNDFEKVTGSQTNCKPPSYRSTQAAILRTLLRSVLYREARVSCRTLQCLQTRCERIDNGGWVLVGAFVGVGVQVVGFSHTA